VTDDLARRLLDIEEIKHLKARYFRLLDAKDWDAWPHVFAEDLEFVYVDLAVQHVPDAAVRQPDGTAVIGRDALVAHIIEAMAPVTTVHHGHMPEITLIDDDTAVGRWGLTNYCEYPTSDGSMAWMSGYGRYRDVYVRTADGWRIKRSEFYRRDML
jgi:3-phenylpropionate/cinnamic acid dioxygenase small subunit